MQISVHGTAFTSYDVKANKQTKEEIAKEKISFDETIKQTNAVENVVYHTTTQADDAKPTTFIDPVTKKYVIASLKNETLDKLRGHFGTDNVVEKKDGTIRLTGDAEAFVSGWFADIAYKREFLLADANNDGNLSDDEILNIKNGLEITIDLNQTSDSFISKTYTRLSKEELELMKELDLEKINSLDEELNMTLKFDFDNDGKISLDEVMVSFGGTLNTIPLEKLKSFDKENCELPIEDMNQVLSFMDYIRTLFLKLKVEAELIKVVDNSLLHNIIEPEQVNKILTKELFELLIKKSDKSTNKLEKDDLPNIKKVENSSNNNIDKIKDTIIKL